MNEVRLSVSGLMLSFTGGSTEVPPTGRNTGSDDTERDRVIDALRFSKSSVESDVPARRRGTAFATVGDLRVRSESKASAKQCSSQRVPALTSTLILFVPKVRNRRIDKMRDIFGLPQFKNVHIHHGFAVAYVSSWPIRTTVYNCNP